MEKFGARMMNKSKKIDYCIAFILGCFILVISSTISFSQENDVSSVYCEALTIDLQDVNAPKYKEDFATLDVKDNSLVVYWAIGISESSCFMWYKSGYPGFDYPMVIEILDNYDDLILQTNEVELTTQWGVYKYEKNTEGFAYKENWLLIDCVSGKQIVNFGREGEDLVIWEKTTKRYYVFKKKEGTTIQV